MNHLKKTLVVANWKLNHTKMDMNRFLDDFIPYFDNTNNTNIDVAIAPVTTILDATSIKLQNSGIFLSAQNVFYKQGAYTGEHSVFHLLELGVKYCLVGHSERRQFFAEQDIDVNKKVLACLEKNIIPIICVGENKEQREQNQVEDLLTNQIKLALKDVSEFNGSFVIAYEPIWAIGTGVIPTEEEINDTMSVIRMILRKHLKFNRPEEVILLYGGSVNSQNIDQLVEKCSMDGFLVGGASLQASSFLTIVNSVSNFKNKQVNL